MPKPRPNLYERIGGATVVESLVDRFYDRVMADPELKPFFKHSSHDGLRKMQREFFGAALDGPVDYSGLAIGQTHHGRGISRRHFALFVKHLLETLQSFEEIDRRDVDEIIRRISMYADEVTGGNVEDG